MIRRLAAVFVFACALRADPGPCPGGVAVIVDCHSMPPLSRRSDIVIGDCYGEAASGEDALKLACELLPDVVLLDISMPGWNGLVTAEKISTACPASAIVMLTVSEDKDKLLAASVAETFGRISAYSSRSLLRPATM